MKDVETDEKNLVFEELLLAEGWTSSSHGRLKYNEVRTVNKGDVP